MRKGKRSLIGLSTVGFAALALVLAGCSSPSGSSRTGHQAKSDQQTASEVKKALDDGPIFKYPDVGVSAYAGTVQLTGFVQTPEQREAAAGIAAKLKGVDRVINGIVLVTVPAGGATIHDPMVESVHVTGGTNQEPPQASGAAGGSKPN